MEYVIFVFHVHFIKFHIIIFIYPFLAAVIGNCLFPQKRIIEIIGIYEMDVEKLSGCVVFFTVLFVT